MSLVPNINPNVPKEWNNFKKKLQTLWKSTKSLLIYVAFICLMLPFCFLLSSLTFFMYQQKKCKAEMKPGGCPLHCNNFPLKESCLEISTVNLLVIYICLLSEFNTEWTEKELKKSGAGSLCLLWPAPIIWPKNHPVLFHCALDPT